MKLVLSSFIFLFYTNTFAFQFSGNLSGDDFKEIIKSLVSGASMKSVSNPYPLGGYTGLQLGMQIENLNTKGLGDLGDATGDNNDINLNVITVGKGLYNNVDIFLAMSPFSSSKGTSLYGGSIRWAFFESEDLPISASITAHSVNVNYDSTVIGESSGIRASIGLSFESSSVYFSAGSLSSKAKFVGGIGAVSSSSSGVTASDFEEREELAEFETSFGGVWEFGSYYTGLELKKTSVSTYTGSIGLRF
ncbi:MAG: hypothetical protein AB8E15_08070 [Bdellovibrionales bacterium]